MSNQVGMNITNENNQPSHLGNAFLTFALFVILIGNLLGNSMVLYVVHHQWKNGKRRVTNSLIANLACIDLLISVVVLFVIIRSVKFRNGIPNTECQLGGFLITTLSAASILTLAVIAIDR